MSLNLFGKKKERGKHSYNGCKNDHKDFHFVFSPPVSVLHTHTHTHPSSQKCGEFLPLNFSHHPGISPLPELSQKEGAKSNVNQYLFGPKEVPLPKL